MQVDVLLLGEAKYGCIERRVDENTITKGSVGVSGMGVVETKVKRERMWVRAIIKDLRLESEEGECRESKMGVKL